MDLHSFGIIFSHTPGRQNGHFQMELDTLVSDGRTTHLIWFCLKSFLCESNVITKKGLSGRLFWWGDLSLDFSLFQENPPGLVTERPHQNVLLESRPLWLHTESLKRQFLQLDLLEMSTGGVLKTVKECQMNPSLAGPN